MSEPQPSSRSVSGTISRASTYLVTNGTKVIGIYLGFKEAARENVRDSVLIFAACLALGAQTVENIVLATIDRFFGGPKGNSS